MMRTDEQLIRLYLKGDEAALETLFTRYLGEIYRYARRFVGDADAASDVAQETFVKAWHNLSSFHQNRNFKAWLFTIAKNTALDWLKKKKAVSFSALEQADPDFSASIEDHTAMTQLTAVSLRRDLNSALAKLPANYSQAITLHLEQGYNFRQVAELLGQPLNTIKSRYHRGLALLKKLI